MAVNDPTVVEQPSPVLAPVPQANSVDVQRAIAEAMRQAEQLQKDESKFPGGRYLVNGVYVDANGDRHKDQKSE